MHSIYEVVDDPGFYRCDEFPRIIVSKSGTVKNAENGNVQPISEREGFYPTFTYPGDVTVLLHRVLAFEFFNATIVDCITRQETVLNKA